LVSIRYEQKIYKSHFLQGNEADKYLYKKYCNKLTKIKVLAKKSYYYKDQFSKHKTDPCKTWDIIHRALPVNKSRKNKRIIEKIIVNNDEILANSQIAQAFNQHFDNVRKKTG